MLALLLLLLSTDAGTDMDHGTTRELTWPEARTECLRSGKYLLVFVGQDARPLKGFVVVRRDGYGGYTRRCVVVVCLVDGKHLWIVGTTINHGSKEEIDRIVQSIGSY